MSSKAQRRACVWVVSGPSGSGKTSLVEALLARQPWKDRLMRSVSCTTRKLRPGEKDGRDYRRLSEREFLKLKKSGGFLETERIFGSYYGTPKSSVKDAEKAGKDLLLCIDVKGARSVRRHFGKRAVSIFVVPPSLKVLRERLRKRSTEGKKDIEKRLRRVRIELSQKDYYDHVVVNDEFKKALNDIKSILKENTQSRSR